MRRIFKINCLMVLIKGMFNAHYVRDNLHYE